MGNMMGLMRVAPASVRRRFGRRGSKNDNGNRCPNFGALGCSGGWCLQRPRNRRSHSDACRLIGELVERRAYGGGPPPPTVAYGPPSLLDEEAPLAPPPSVVSALALPGYPPTGPRSLPFWPLPEHLHQPQLPCPRDPTPPPPVPLRMKDYCRLCQLSHKSTRKNERAKQKKKRDKRGKEGKGGERGVKTLPTLPIILRMSRLAKEAGNDFLMTNGEDDQCAAAAAAATADATADAAATAAAAAAAATAADAAAAAKRAATRSRLPTPPLLPPRNPGQLAEEMPPVALEKLADESIPKITSCCCSGRCYRFRNPMAYYGTWTSRTDTQEPVSRGWCLDALCPWVIYGQHQAVFCVECQRPVGFSGDTSKSSPELRGLLTYQSYQDIIPGVSWV